MYTGSLFVYINGDVTKEKHGAPKNKNSNKVNKKRKRIYKYIYVLLY